MLAAHRDSMRILRVVTYVVPNSVNYRKQISISSCLPGGEGLLSRRLHARSFVSLRGIVSK